MNFKLKIFLVVITTKKNFSLKFIWEILPPGHALFLSFLIQVKFLKVDFFALCFHLLYLEGNSFNLVFKNIWPRPTFLKTKINEMPSYHSYKRNMVPSAGNGSIMLKKPLFRIFPLLTPNFIILNINLITIGKIFVHRAG